MAELVCVDPQHLGAVWPHVRSLLLSATDRTGLSSFDDIENETLRGNGLLWLAVSGNNILGAATTVLVTIDRNKICILTACGGAGAGDWLHLLGGIENYAKNEGCRSLRIYGRKGWLRALEGYREMAIVIEKGLV